MKSNWNGINFQITYSFHQAFWWTAFKQNIIISKFKNKSTWKNYTNYVMTCCNPLIYKTSLKSTLSRCCWKNECNEWWKKRCRENEHIINSTSIETMCAAKGLKKWKILKNLFSRKQLQTKNYTQNKNFKIWKTIDTNVVNKKKLWRLIK